MRHRGSAGNRYRGHSAQKLSAIYQHRTCSSQQQFLEWDAGRERMRINSKRSDECLQEADLYKEALHSIASIDLKKEEPGLLSLAEAWQLPFETFTEEELKAVQGEFTPSEFVKKITGVDNVCERSAVLASGAGNPDQKKNRQRRA